MKTLFLFFLIAPFFSGAQESANGNAAVIALNGLTTVAGAPWSGPVNPALLSSTGRFSAGFTCMNHFAIKELFTNSLQVVVPVKQGGTSGIQYERFGNRYYHQSDISVSHGLKLGNRMSLGAAIGYRNARAMESTTTHAQFTSRVGIRFSATKHLIVGAEFGSGSSNPAFGKQLFFKAGAGYRLSAAVQVLSEITYLGKPKPPLVFAIQYHLADKAFITYSIRTFPFGNSAGIGFRSGCLRFDLAFRHQRVLGFSPSATLTWTPEKK